MKRKAQSISINTIVVAAIALVVMVLLILIFTQYIGRWGRSANDCFTQKGTCVDRDEQYEQCAGQFDTVRRDLVCYDGRDPDPDKVCCQSN